MNQGNIKRMPAKEKSQQKPKIATSVADKTKKH